MTQKNRYKDTKNVHPEKGAALPSRNWDAAYAGFVNFNPTDAQKDAFVHWADSAEPFLIMDTHLALGRKISFAIDKDGVTHTCSCMERDSTSVNAGLICTARGRTSELAWFRLMYYLGVLFPENWNELSLTKSLDRW